VLTPWLTSLDGTVRLPLLSIGPYGSWADLQVTTRWGEGASGMYEAQWSMPLPPQFEHPLLRRGSLVELLDGPYRVGSPLVLSEPTVGSGVEDPWQFVASGIGRETEGENSLYAFSPTTGLATATPSEAVDNAVTNQGWRVAGRAASVPTSAASGLAEGLATVGSVLSTSAQSLGQRWYVGQDNLVAFAADPTTPTYQVTPGAAALGSADDNYASVVRGVYTDSATGSYGIKTGIDTNTNTQFGRQEYAVDLTPYGPISGTVAQGWVNSILARSKGRLAWTNSLTLTSYEIQTIGGVPADLSKVLEDVANGCMVRIHGIFSRLLEMTGQTWIDIVIGQAQYADGTQTIQLSPIGLAPRDLSSIMEEVTGMAAS
jgi:hypothetical protein